MLLPLFLTFQYRATDTFTCSSLNNLASIAPRFPFKNEVVLISGFGNNQLNPQSAPLLEEILNATFANKGGKWSATRTKEEQSAMQGAEIAEITTTYNDLLSKYKTIADRVGHPLGSPELAYSMTKEYANSLRLRLKDPNASMPWFNERAGQPGDSASLEIEKLLLAGHLIQVSPYKEFSLAAPQVGTLGTLPGSASSILTHYNQLVSTFNDHVQQKGEPAWTKPIIESAWPGYKVFAPIAPVNSPAYTVYSHEEDANRLDFELQYYDNNGNILGGGEQIATLATVDEITANKMVDSTRLTIDPTSEQFLRFVTYRHSKQPAYYLDNKPVYETIYSDKSHFPLDFYSPEQHDPLSYFVSDLIVKMAHAYGYNKVIGDLPDSLLSAFAIKLGDSSSLTALQVRTLLRQSGLSLMVKNGSLMLMPVMLEAVEAIRESRAPYQTSLHLILKNGSLTLYELLKFRAETEVSLMNRYQRLRYSEGIPILDQECFRFPTYSHLCNDSWAIFLGTMSPEQWQGLAKYPVLFSNESTLRKEWWKYFFLNGSTHDLTMPINDGASTTSGSSSTLSNKVQIEFAYPDADGFPIRIYYRSTPRYELTQSFRPPLASPPFHSLFLQFGEQSSLGSDIKFIASRVKSDLAGVPKEQWLDFIREYIRFKTFARQDVEYAVGYPNDKIRYGSVRLDLDNHRTLTFDQLPKDAQQAILNSLFPVGS